VHKSGYLKGHPQCFGVCKFCGPPRYCMSAPSLHSLIYCVRCEQSLHIDADHDVCRCYENGYLADTGERVPGPTCVFPNNGFEDGVTVPRAATFQPPGFVATEGDSLHGT
jgi:hypothetical protein